MGGALEAIHQSLAKKVALRAGYDNGLVRSFFLMRGWGVRWEGLDDVVTWMVLRHSRVSLAISIYRLTLGPASSEYRRTVVPSIVGTLTEFTLFSRHSGRAIVHVSFYPSPVEHLKLNFDNTPGFAGRAPNVFIRL